MSNSVAAISGGAILAFAHALPWLARRSERFIENPAKLAAALSAVQVLPQFILVSIWPDESAVSPLLGDDFGALLTRFALLYALSMCALLYGIRKGIGNSRQSAPINVHFEPNYYIPAFIAFSVYIVTMYLIVEKVGGISSFVNAAGVQNEFQSGIGLIAFFKTPASYMAIMFMAVQYARTGRPNIVFLMAFVLLIVGIEATLGSRRAPIQLIIFAVIAVYTMRPNAKLLSAINVLVAVMCAAIFVGILNLRDQASGLQEERGIASYIANFSYNDMYMFVLHHFSFHEFWYGKVFLDFQYRFTGGLGGFPAPSLDEGVYIYNLFLGRPVSPPLPVELMAHNSWPPRTFGNGYMNFGVPGIVVFSFIQGWLTGKAYSMSVRSDRHPIFQFLFLNFVFSFQVSNLKLTELAVVAIGLPVLFGPAYLAERARRRALQSAISAGTNRIGGRAN